MPNWRNEYIADVTIAGPSIGLRGKRRAIAARAVNGQRLMVGSGSKPVRLGGGEDAYPITSQVQAGKWVPEKA